MSKKKNKNRLRLLLKLDSNPVARLKDETPEEYIYRVFKMANSELEEHFDVWIDGILANAHIRYIKENLHISPRHSQRIKNERFYRCQYYISQYSYGKIFFK